MKLFSYATLALGISLIFTDLNALTLKESIVEVINTNPIVKERLRNYRATQQDLNIAEAKYLPTVDLRVATGLHKPGNLNSDINNDDFRFYESSLKLTQNIFDGYKTKHQIDYEKTRILAASFNYIEKVNDISFEMASVYLNVLKNYELLENAKENIKMNERLLEDIKSLYKAKLVTKTDLKKVQASLSMAETNYIILENNKKDAEYSFARVLGRKPIIDELSLPSIDVTMPVSMEDATIDALKNNPSLLVSQYNIKGAKALYRRDKHNFYPKVDFELEQLYDNVNEDNNGFESDDDRLIARFQLKWNLYNGGADSALVQKRISKLKQENEIKRDLKRQVIEGLELSYSAYEVVTKQIEKLNMHNKFTSEILESLLEEYKLGKKSRRTILDILNANSNVINGKSRVISARFDRLYAQYRILDAMGLLVTVVAGNESEYKKRVNIGVEKPIEILDTLEINLDEDNDEVIDDLDICDNSELGSTIKLYGCVKTGSSSQNISENKEEQTPIKTVVEKKDLNTKALEDLNKPKVKEVISSKKDTDKDGILDENDQCLNTPFGFKVDDKGCADKINLRVNFENNSSIISKLEKPKIISFSSFLKKYPQYKATIVGHTSNVGSAKYNQWLSERRARKIVSMLKSLGIKSSRLDFIGRGESNPIATNSTEAGQEQNRRIIAELELMQ